MNGKLKTGFSGISFNRFIVRHPHPSHPIRKTDLQDIVTS